MAQNGSIFRKSSRERISSPEQLNDYIRVASPSVWVVLAALLALAAAGLVWGFAGALPSSVSAVGFAENGRVVCYLTQEQAAGVAPGMEVRAGELTGAVAAVEPIPLSAREVSQQLGSDYLPQRLALSDWNVPVTVSLPGAPEGAVRLSIITQSIRPIDFLLN